MNEQNQQTQYDPQAVAMVRAIKMQESSNNYDAPKEKAGQSLGGAYQYQAPTWKAYAGEILGDPNAQFTPGNQDKVTYGMVKKWKDAGLQPSDIAHKWNPGDPTYPDKVVTHLRAIAQGATPGQGYNPNPFSQPAPGAIDVTGLTTQSEVATPAPKPTDLGGELTQRATDVGTNVGKTLMGIGDISTGNVAQGGKEIFHGLIQGAGAVAGGLGDVVNKAIEKTPVLGDFVKGVEGLIGSGVSSFAQTEAGKSVFQSVSDFAKTHPELSKDIGAGVNIVTAIPILKGIGMVATVAKDAASSALENTAKKIFTEEASAVVGKTMKGGNFIRSNPGAVKTIIDEGILPEIKGTVYDVQPSVDKSHELIQSINADVKEKLKNNTASRIGNESEEIVGNVLNGYTDRNGNVIKGFVNSNFTPEEIIDMGKNLTPQNGRLWDKFVRGDATMADINTLRSDLDTAVKSVYTSISEPPIKKDVGATLSGAMRNYVQSYVPETQADFARMADLFKAQKTLEFMRDKPVKSGGVGGFVKDYTSGIPIVSRVGNKAASKLAGTTVGILKRTGPEAARIGAREAISKTGGLVGGAFAQKVSGQ